MTVVTESHSSYHMYVMLVQVGRSWGLVLAFAILSLIRLSAQQILHRQSRGRCSRRDNQRGQRNTRLLCLDNQLLRAAQHGIDLSPQHLHRRYGARISGFASSFWANLAREKGASTWATPSIGWGSPDG